MVQFETFLIIQNLDKGHGADAWLALMTHWDFKTYVEHDEACSKLLERSIVKEKLETSFLKKGAAYVNYMVTVFMPPEWQGVPVTAVVGNFILVNDDLYRYLAVNSP